MTRWGRGRYSGSRRVGGYTAPASEAERAQAKQVIIARVERLDQLPFITNITGSWPRHGEIVAFHLDIGRGGKPKAMIFTIPVTAPPAMLKTEITITTQQPPEGSIPVAQFRQLCFYRIVNKMREWLEESDPQDDKEILHYIALFEHQVKDAMRKRQLEVTSEVERQWTRYKKLRERYMLLKEESEKAHAGGIAIRLAKTFLTTMNRKG